MAGMTIQSFMFAIQFVVGLVVVVKAPQFPAVGVMTQFAIITETLFMRVFGLVTGNALYRRTLERRGQMTFLTGSDGVLSNKRKVGQIMIKNHLVSPTVFIVATLAPVTFLALVFVVQAMAGMTFGADFFLECISFVTFLTFDFPVFAA